MAGRNRIERREGFVRKHFSSHLDYSKESRIYEKLKGSGLAPELTASYDGLIEHRFVEGPCFWDLCIKYSAEPQKLASVFESFCEWYVGYRKLTGLILGNLNPAKFILTDKGFVYIDFEHCKPGYAEQDIARMVSWFCSETDPSAGASSSEEQPSGVFPASAGREAAKLFVCVCYGQMQLRGDKLSEFLTEEFSASGVVSESLISYLTSSGVVITPESSSAVSGATAFLASSPERFLCGISASDLSCPGFDFISAPSIALAVYAAARRSSCEWLAVLNAADSTDEDAVNRLLSAEKDGMDAAFFRGSAFALPLFIRKETALALFASAGPDEELGSLLEEKARCTII